MALIDPLLVPIRLRGTGLANRIAMSPMTRYHSPGGVPTEEVASYYTRRAASGLGLILTEGVSIPHYAATDDPSVPAMHGETALAAWQQIVDAVHAVGGRIMPQLWHQGVMWQVERPGGDNRSAMRPSGIWGPPDGVISIPADARDAQLAATRPMSDSHIQDIIDAYASAASNAAAIGFDGIAIHGAHGYLIDSFLWDYTNRRTDAWGGNEAARAVFGCAVVRAIRAEIGEELPIILRISQFKMQDYRARLADTPDQLAA